MLPIRTPNPWHVLSDEFDALPSLGLESFVNCTPTLLLTDVLECDDSLLVSVNLPGAVPLSITASLSGQHLLIAAQLETVQSSAVYLWRERPTGLVQRTITLPGRLAGIASATYEYGVLTVRVSKALGRSGRTIHVVSRPRLKARADQGEALRPTKTTDLNEPD